MGGGCISTDTNIIGVREKATGRWVKKIGDSMLPPGQESEHKRRGEMTPYGQRDEHGGL